MGLNVQYAEIRLEATPGVYNADAGAERFFLPGTMENQANVREEISVAVLNEAGIFNRPRQSFVTSVKGAGTVRFPVHYGFMNTLAKICLPVVSPPARPRLPTFTLTRFDGVLAKRFRGCTLGEITFAASSQSPAVLTCEANLEALAYDVLASGTFAPPTNDDLPLDDPVHFRESKALINIAGVRSNYTSLTIKIQNALALKQYEDINIGAIDYAGRRVGVQLALDYVDNADNARVVNQVPHTGVIAFKRTGTPDQEITFNFGDGVTFLKTSETTPYDSRSDQTIDVVSLARAVAITADLNITVA